MINYFIKCYWILYTSVFYDFGIDIQEENGAAFICNLFQFLKLMFHTFSKMYLEISFLFQCSGILYSKSRWCPA